MAELIGIIDICCTPPATTTSCTPAITAWAAKWMACCAEPHCRSIGGAGHVLGQAGGEPAGAGDVAGLAADGVDAAEHHVLDRARVDAGAVDEGAERVGAEVGGVDLAQAAAALPDGRADGVDDEGFGHGVILPCWRPTPQLVFHPSPGDTDRTQAGRMRVDWRGAVIGRGLEGGGDPVGVVGGVAPAAGERPRALEEEVQVVPRPCSRWRRGTGAPSGRPARRRRTPSPWPSTRRGPGRLGVGDRPRRARHRRARRTRARGRRRPGGA